MYKLPGGTQDYLPHECAAKRRLEKALRRLFFNSGFDEVETSTIEYFDVFSRGFARQREEHMFKFFDSEGRILVLRPDITVPIARMVTTKMEVGISPLRLFYIQNAFGVREYNIGQRGEYTQAGVELIGRGGDSVDGEIAALAISAMTGIGLRDFKLELGQVEFFKSLVEEAGIGHEDAERLRQCIDTKDTIGLEYAISCMELPAQTAEKLMELPNLFGGREVLERARALSDTPRCAAAIDNIAHIYDALADFGLGEHVVLDLGMLTNMEYYSGVVFRGITDAIGFPILSGGRYDPLYGEFGRPMPAIGFAMGIGRAMIALERQRRESGEEEELVDRVYIFKYNESQRARVFQMAATLRTYGLRAILQAEVTPEELEIYKENDRQYIFADESFWDRYKDDDEAEIILLEMNLPEYRDVLLRELDEMFGTDHKPDDKPAFGRGRRRGGGRGGRAHGILHFPTPPGAVLDRSGDESEGED